MHLAKIAIETEKRASAFAFEMFVNKKHLANFRTLLRLVQM